MSWAKLDDRYDDNRKIKRAWRRNRAAVGLHAMAITYCSRHRTDGVVDIDWLEERLPAEKERAKVIGVLVDGGLFEPVDAEHWRVHDYLDYNPSRQARDEASDAARNAALVRWSKEQDAARTAEPDADGSAEGMRDPMPHPSRPDPTKEKQARERTTGGERQPSRRVDQDELPDDLDERLQPVAERTLSSLTDLWKQRGGAKPTRRGVGLAVKAYQDRDIARVVGELEHWSLAGHGAGRPVKDWTQTLRSFLERSPVGSPARLHAVGPERQADLTAKLVGS